MTGLENTSGYKTFQATAVAIAAYSRVKVDSSGLISVAAAAEAAVGVVMEAVAASGYGTVKLFSAGGSFPMIASVAITNGTQVYPAASGKIAASGTTALNFQAIEAATANNDIIECVRIEKGA
jgi:hypothetical protein